MQSSSLPDRRLDFASLLHFVRSRRGIGVMLLSPLLGPLVLLLLLWQPGAERAFGTPELHFVVVTGAALGAVAVAVLLLRAALLRQDGRVLLIGTGFLLLSMTFLTHAVSTPGVLFNNTLAATRWSTPVALLVGACWLAISASDRVALRSALTQRWRIVVYGSLLVWLAYSAFMLLYVPWTGAPATTAVAAAHVGAHADYTNSTVDGSAQPVGTVGDLAGPDAESSAAVLLQRLLPTAFPWMFGTGALLYLVAALMYGVRWLQQPTRPLLALTSGSLLLAETAIAANYASFGQASFWLYHVLLVAAILIVGYGVTVGVEQSGTLSSAVEGLLLGATLDRQRRAFHSGMAALLSALEQRKIESLPELRRELHDRFGLANDQLALLEHAVQLVAREREEQHRWRTLAEVSATVTQHLNATDLLRDSAAALARSTEARLCAIGTVVDDQIVFAAEAIERDDGQRIKGRSLPKDVICDPPFEGAQPRLCDLSAEQSPTGVPLLGAIVAPLRHGQQLLGLLVLQLPLESAADERVLTLTSAVAAHLSNGLASARLHADLQQKHARLERSEQARTELTQMVAHDLKNPLTGVRGYLALLEMGELNADQRELLGGAMRSSSVLLRLIDEMLDVARLEEGKLDLKRVPCPADDLLHASVDEMRPWLVQDGRTIAVDVPSSPPSLWIDVNLLRRVLVNLLSNALKHTPREANVRLAVSSCPDHIEIVVADTGPGIPAEKLPHVFERFQAANAQPQRQSSTGLGLAFCKLAVEAHGGTIAVESSPGIGTRFQIELPVTDCFETAQLVPQHELVER